MATRQAQNIKIDYPRNILKDEKFLSEALLDKELSTKANLTWIHQLARLSQLFIIMRASNLIKSKEITILHSVVLRYSVNNIASFRVSSLKFIFKMNKIILLCLLVAAAVSAQVNAGNLTRFPGEECFRNCRTATPRICYFHWNLEHYHVLGP